MADYSKEFERMKFSYIFNTNMASIDPDDVDEYPVFEMSDTVLSALLADAFADDRERLLRSQKHLQQARRRYDHALRRLRQKGYCTEKSLVDLLDSIIDPSTAPAIASTVWVCVGNTVESRGFNVEITDDTWFRAIDRLLVLTNKRLLSDKDTSIISYCEDHILELYILLDDSIAQSMALFTCEEAADTLRRGEDLFTRSDVKGLLHTAIKAFAASHAEKLAAVERDLKSGNEENARLSEAVEALKREMRQREKECYALRKENGFLTEDLSRIRALPSIPAPAPSSDEPASNDYDIEFEDIEIPDAEDLPDLPKTGVMFVGGHPNFIKKLKDVYPNWAYIGSENAPELLKQYSKLEMCFIYTGHVSHPVYWDVLNSAKSSGAPYSFVKGTNLDRVITEMRQDYAVALQGRQPD